MRNMLQLQLRFHCDDSLHQKEGEHEEEEKQRRRSRGEAEAEAEAEEETEEEVEEETEEEAAEDRVWSVGVVLFFVNAASWKDCTTDTH